MQFAPFSRTTIGLVGLLLWLALSGAARRPSSPPPSSVEITATEAAVPFPSTLSSTSIPRTTSSSEPSPFRYLWYSLLFVAGIAGIAFGLALIIVGIMYSGFLGIVLGGLSALAGTGLVWLLSPRVLDIAKPKRFPFNVLQTGVGAVAILLTILLVESPLLLALALLSAPWLVLGLWRFFRRD